MSEAGLDLDALIAEKLFGVSRKKIRHEEGHNYQYYIPSGKLWRTHAIDARPVPWFSRDMEAAMQVVERLQVLGWTVRIGQYQLNPVQWNCRFVPIDTSAYVFADAQSPALAVCLAALKVVGVEV